VVANDTNRTNVVYIAGWGRSGSTLLDQVLGEVEGWFSCGELHFVWRNLPCGCGVPVHECDFWRPLLESALEGDPGEGSAEMMEIQRRHLGASPLHLVGIRRARSAGAGSPQLRYADVLARLYAGIAGRAGARVVVDSSKLATDAYLAACLTDTNFYVVHLIRDPRATAYSWGRLKLEDPGDPESYFGRLSPARSSAYWLRRNAVIEAVLRPRLGDRYLRLRYEDFVREPQEAVRSILALLGEGDAKLPFVDERTVVLNGNHTVAGNPLRFSAGTCRVRADDEWRGAMDPARRRLATLAAAPLMPHYGYPLVAR
jgi:Sulfotransferase family